MNSPFEFSLSLSGKVQEEKAASQLEFGLKLMNQQRIRIRDG
jgi:hypothetical protein